MGCLMTTIWGNSEIRVQSDTYDPEGPPAGDEPSGDVEELADDVPTPESDEPDAHGPESEPDLTAEHQRAALEYAILRTLGGRLTGDALLADVSSRLDRSARAYREAHGIRADQIGQLEPLDP